MPGFPVVGCGTQFLKNWIGMIKSGRFHIGDELCAFVLQGKVTGEERLLRDMQPRERIRDIAQGPDGALYLATDSPKGRILRVAPKK